MRSIRGSGRKRRRKRRRNFRTIRGETELEHMKKIKSFAFKGNPENDVWFYDTSTTELEKFSLLFSFFLIMVLNTVWPWCHAFLADARTITSLPRCCGMSLLLNQRHCAFDLQHLELGEPAPKGILNERTDLAPPRDCIFSLVSCFCLLSPPAGIPTRIENCSHQWQL